MKPRILRHERGNIVYVWVKCPYEYRSMANKLGYVPEHRLVMAKFLGRALRKNEYIRHKDGDTQNNCCKNLVIRRYR